MVWKGVGAAPLVLPDADGAPNKTGMAVSISPNGIIAGVGDRSAGTVLRWVPDSAGKVYTAETLRGGSYGSRLGMASTSHRSEGGGVGFRILVSGDPPPSK